MAKVTTRTGFFKRLWNSVIGVFVGILLVGICLYGLFQNESRSVKTMRALTEVENECIQLHDASVRSENEGKLIAITGGNLTFTPVSDPDFRIQTNSFVLDRIVEMYQWRENARTTTRDLAGGGQETTTEYTYEKVWSKDLINSANFNKNSSTPSEQNPTAMRVTSTNFYANDVKLGEFNLTQDQLRELPTEPYMIPTGVELSRPWRLENNYITDAVNSTQPAIGDIRISYRHNPNRTASAIGQQQGSNIVPYISRNKTKISRIFSGSMRKIDMVDELRRENTFITWVLRIIFTILICTGFTMILTPLTVILGVIPFLGKVSRAIASFVGALIGIALSAVVIAISWILVRPLVGLSLLAVAAGLIAMIMFFRKKKIEISD
jgi:hypothetical protein